MLKVEYVSPLDLRSYENNAKEHPAEQIEQIKKSIREFGFNDPIAVWKDNVIIEGHGRLIAALELDMDEVPIIRLDSLTDEQRKAYGLVHNKLTMNSGFDLEMLNIELSDIIDIDMTTYGFELDSVDYVLEPEAEPARLDESFIVPPFSVLDTRSGRWQDRKRMWLEKTGDLSKTRDGEFGRFGDSIIRQINGGTSNFDPVLAETMYLWFCPDGGRILDPFGGEQTKGIVAGECGYQYSAVEIRPEQVAVNKDKTKDYEGVRYYQGDSNDISKIVKERDFDMLFTSPPYYDLEVYSSEDLSALGSYEEFMQQYKNIFAQCYEMLADNSFAVVKVGEIRNKKTGEYRNFVADTINTFREIGFTYYNEIILVNAVGTAMLRVGRSMQSRKVGKVHQNVLVFYKGDLKEIPNKFKDLHYDDEEFSDISE